MAVGLAVAVAVGLAVAVARKESRSTRERTPGWPKKGWRRAPSRRNTCKGTPGSWIKRIAKIRPLSARPGKG